MKKSPPVVFIDRATGEKTVESVMGDKALRFAYETLLGRTLWPVLFGSRAVSAFLGRRYDSPKSKKDIASLASIPGCRPEEAEKPLEDYASFNEFFTRRLKPGARPFGDGFASPADGRLAIYPSAAADAPFPLKGAVVNLREVFSPGDPSRVLPERFDVIVVRLAPVDYHRFHFPCDCKVASSPRIVPGRYDSVNPVALLRRPDVYARNERHIAECEAAFGRFWMVEVGAFGVGTIVQTFKPGPVAKGSEKGFFKFGGSTVIVAAEAGALEFDRDIAANSAAGFETRVLCGERIAAAPGAA